MTLVICAIAAVAAAAAWQFVPAARPWHVGSLALAYAGAALMWCVDEVANLVNGEPVLNWGNAAAMTDDACLGVLIVIAGLAVWTLAAGFKALRHQPA